MDYDPRYSSVTKAKWAALKRLNRTLKVRLHELLDIQNQVLRNRITFQLIPK